MLYCTVPVLQCAVCGAHIQEDGSHACEQAARVAYGVKVFKDEHREVVATAASLAKCGICPEL